ncbi:MAG TPA: glycosyltransferase [Acidobacteriaceae bacterium]|jgi:glycosyltransferase involved in cell wall biosynthesis
MRVLIAAASASTAISGVQRHALNVARCLLSRPEISAVHFVVAPWQRDMMKKSGLYPNARLHVHLGEMQQGTFSRNRWYYKGLPALADRLDAEIVHLSYPVPVDARSFHCPTVVTLHDLYPYEIPMNFGFPHVLFNRLILQQCLRSVDAVAVVSSVTGRRLKDYAPKTVWPKSVHIPNCVEADPHSALESPLPGWTGEPFLLCVAQHRRNKNIPLLLRAFHRLLQSEAIVRNTRLVLVGIEGPETPLIRRVVASLKLGKNVLELQGLSEPDLQWCYRNCETVLAPSVTEGFGLPVAEALLAGTRVVCSDIPAFRELGEGHCRFVRLEGNSEAVLADAILASLHDSAQEPVLLPQFSTAAIAGQYLDLYRGLVVAASSLNAAELNVPAHVPSTERRYL